MPKIAFLLLAGVLALGGAFAATGFFTIDEVVHFMGTRALAESGSLVVANGYERFGSRSLLLDYLVAGPGGPVTQYPSGGAMLAAPLFPTMGLRAFIALNIVATLVTVWATVRIADRIAGRRGVGIGAGLLLVCSSFSLEYAFGIWPHAIAMAFATGALLCALGMLGEGRAPLRHAALAGLLVGLGMLVRVDIAFILPPIGIAAVVFAKRPIITGFALAAGLVPGLLLGGWMNAAKFGTYNPLSYGSSGGNTDMTAYVGIIAALGLGVAALLAGRFAHDRTSWRPSGMVMIGLALAGVVLAVSFGAATMQLLRGAWFLLIDIRAIPAPDGGFVRNSDGTVTMWGLTKKSLAQSMPWLGILCLLPLAARKARQKSGVALLCLTVGLYLLPFCWLAWHGGASSNMRYFLNIVPALCVLGSVAMQPLFKETRQVFRPVAAGILLACLAAAAWVRLHPSQIAGLQQGLSLALFLAIAGLSIWTLFSARTAIWPRWALIAAASPGIGIGALNGALDLATSQAARANSRDAHIALSGLEQPYLIIGRPVEFAANLDGAVAIGASGSVGSGGYDPELVRSALGAGYRVYAVLRSDDLIPRNLPDLVAEEIVIDNPRIRLVSLEARP